MARTLACRPALAEAAQRFAPSRRYWAIVGNGVNQIAAQEMRIKLSELCYKSIACDATEDKKHIDLSSEPLILVCAAGLTGSTADDVAKEIAIYRAHKAAPIVIASEGEERFSAALQVDRRARRPTRAWPSCCRPWPATSSATRRRWPSTPRPARCARPGPPSRRPSRAGSRRGGDDLLADLAPSFEAPAARFFDGLRSGEYDGHLEASTAVRLASLFRYALGVLPLEAYQVEYGKVGTPSVVIEDLTSALTRAIEELTRPVDAIKHQAKTVTVGISRSDESLLQVPLVREVLAAGVARDQLSYGSLRTLATLDPASSRSSATPATASRAASTTTATRPGRSSSTGAASAASSAAAPRPHPELRGTKHRVADRAAGHRGRGPQRRPHGGDRPRGQGQPEPPGSRCCTCASSTAWPLVAMRSVLQGYRGRYPALKDAVTETEPTFRDDLLGALSVVDLLTAPLNDLADHWRT